MPLVADISTLTQQKVGLPWNSFRISSLILFSLCFFSVKINLGGWTEVEVGLNSPDRKKMDRSQIFRPSLNKSRLYLKNLGLFLFSRFSALKKNISGLVSDPLSKVRKSRSSYFRVHSVLARRSAHRVCSEFARNCVSNIGDRPPSGA